MSHHPHPRETLERCALRAQLRGDTMIGTAFPAARLLLVEQPGPWGRNGLRDSRFDAATARTLEQRANANGVRVQAIRRYGRTPRGAIRHWVLIDTRDGRESVRAGTYERDADLLELDLDGQGGEIVLEPLYLICAHSKHDTCCALRGRPVAAALDAIRPGRAWETTHLGGDRFGANVLVVPSGLLYGRVLPFAAEEFVAAAEAGEVLPSLLRGQIGLTPVAQAALAYAYELLALRRRDDLTVDTVSATVDGAALVRVRAPHGRFDVTVLVERVDTVGLTCSRPGPSWFLQHRAVAITEAVES